MKRVIALAVLVVVVMAGATPAFAAPPVVLTETELTAGLLAPTAVPGGGWTPAAPGVLESRPWAQANDIEGGWCDGGTDAYAAGELQVAATAQATLAKSVAPDEPTWFIWTKAYSFPDVGRAKSFLETVVAAEAFCESWVLSGEPINGVSAEAVPIVAIGNQRLALRTTTSGDGVSETQDYVYVRIRNNVVVTHTRISPPDDSLVVSIAKRSAKALKKAVKAAA